MQRQKGARGERQVRDIFRAAGFGSDRTPNSGGLHIPGDVSCTLDDADVGLHVESKWHERVRILEWIDQAREDCPKGAEPLVAWRTSRMAWRADVDLVWLVSKLAELETLKRR